MPKINTKEYVIVETTFAPPVRSMKEVLLAKQKMGGGTFSRQALEKSDLTFGVVMANKKTREAGYKVVVVDEKLERFLSK